jgi:hypothetical protein
VSGPCPREPGRWCCRRLPCLAPLSVSPPFLAGACGALGNRGAWTWLPPILSRVLGSCDRKFLGARAVLSLLIPWDKQLLLQCLVGIARKQEPWGP